MNTKELGINLQKYDNLHLKIRELEQEIADYTTDQKLPAWFTIEELLELHYASDNALTLTYEQKDKLLNFKEALEIVY